MCLAVLLGGLSTNPARAQPLPNQEQVPARDIEAAQAAERAALAAEEQQAIEGAPVEFPQVLADPDNIDLNYRYARTQVQRGELRSAAATLERLLLVDPAAAQARLLYAVVLFRLDDLDEAEREFARVRNLPMPDTLRAEIDRYLQQIEIRRKRTRWVASLSLGLQYDSNRTATPDQFRAFDLVGPAGSKEDDLAALAIGTIGFRHDLGYQARHELFGLLTYYHAEQNEVQEQDLQAFAAEFGGTWRGELVDVSPSLTHSNLRLNRERFLRSTGAKLRLDRHVSALVDVFATNHLQWQDFDAVTALADDGRATAPLAPERTGLRNDTEFGATFTLTPTHQVTAAYLHTIKDAREDYHAYDGDEVALTHTWLLGRGQFLLTTLSAELQRYEGSDPLISTRTRRDEIYRARITYGIPLGTLAPGALPPALADMTLTATGEALSAESNIENFDYENLRAQVLLTKRWLF